MSTMLKHGSRGDDVFEYQKKLVHEGFMTEADLATGPGIFGPKTQAATKKMQDRLVEKAFLSMDDAQAEYGRYGEKTQTGFDQSLHSAIGHVPHTVTKELQAGAEKIRKNNMLEVEGGGNGYVNGQELRSAIVRNAASHVGIEETLGENRGPEVTQFQRHVGLRPGDPWCSAFGGCVLDESLPPGCPALGKDFRSVLTVRHQAQECGAFTSAKDVSKNPPKPGDFLLLENLTEANHGHLAIVTSYDAKTHMVQVISGNHYEDGVAHDGVRRHSYRLDTPDSPVPGDPAYPNKIAGIVDIEKFAQVSQIKIAAHHAGRTQQLAGASEVNRPIARGAAHNQTRDVGA